MATRIAGIVDRTPRRSSRGLQLADALVQLRDDRPVERGVRLEGGGGRGGGGPGGGGGAPNPPTPPLSRPPPFLRVIARPPGNMPPRERGRGDRGSCPVLGPNSRTLAAPPIDEGGKAVVPHRVRVRVQRLPLFFMSASCRTLF